MIVYIDTNVIIDLLAEREPFYDDAFNLFYQIAKDNSRLTAYTSLKSISDIYYVMHKYYHDKTKTMRSISNLISLLYVADNNDLDLLRSFSSKLNDFEDSLIDELSARYMMDYIVTRNMNDFKNSKVTAITPKKCLEILNLPELEAD